MKFTAKKILVSSFLLIVSSMLWAQVPNAASNLIVYKTGTTELSLSWTDNSVDELGFIVQRSDDDLFLTPFTIDTVTADDTSYVFAPASTYYFRIVAYNASGNAPASNVEFGSVDSYPGSALSFDGIDDQVNLGNISSLSSVTEFTIEGWYNQTALDETRGMFVMRESVSDQIRARTWSDGNLYVYLHNGNTFNASYDYSQSVSAGEWFHLALVFNGAGATNADRFKLYIDGAEVTLTYNGTAPTSTSSNSGDFILSEDLDGDSNLWNGLMDDFKIWDHAKTDFSNRYTPLIGNEPGLLAYYSFDENAGTTLYDRSVNTNDGTITGTPTWVSSFTQTFEVTNINDSGAGSLRQAILDANASTEPFVEIGFSGLNAGDVITLSSVLPFITRPMVIDATTATGWDINTGQMVVLDGSSTPNATNGGGIRINADSVEVYGLHIDGFSQTINLGLYSTGSYNVIGAPGKGNVITNNTQGISFVGGDFNSVQGNYIGTDFSLTDLGNNRSGIVLTQGASFNIIGGDDPSEANYIYHNGASSVAPGVDILYNTSVGNQIVGNSMSCNSEASISFDPAYGGAPQNGIEAPYFTSISPTEITGYVNDTIPVGSEVHLYQSTDTCSNDQGKLYLGKATIFDDGGSKKFSYSGSFGNHAYSATLTTLNDGTSVMRTAGYFSVDNTADSGAGTLRDALTFSNALDAQNTWIDFNYAGGGPWTATISSALPTMNSSFTLDGSTQEGFDFAADNMITINGSVTNFLTIQSGTGTDDVTIEKLKFTGFTGSTIISNNTGTGQLRNLRIDSCVFGGVGSSSTHEVLGLVDATLASITNNYFGYQQDSVTSTGMTINGGAIVLDSFVDSAYVFNNLIGNVSHVAISLNSVNNGALIKGNTIGLDGKKEGANATSGTKGIYLTSNNTVIEDNYIANYSTTAIELFFGVQNTTVLRNVIGENINGVPMPNGKGFQIDDRSDLLNTHIGGGFPDSNIISNSTGAAISVDGPLTDQLFIEANSIYNNGQGIVLNGANSGITAPSIDFMAYDSIGGTVASDGLIHIYSGDGNGQGQTIIDSVSSSGGYWEYQGALGSSGDQIVVTLTDANGTSEFASAFIPFTDNALNFDGAGDYVAMGSPAALQITGALTYEVWIKKDPSVQSFVMGRRNSDAAAGIASNLEMGGTGLIQLTVNNGATTSQTVSSVTAIDDGQWHHVAAVYEPSTALRIYIDGQLDNENTSAIFASLNAATLPFHLGYRHASTPSYFTGSMDEVRVWSEARPLDSLRKYIQTPLTGNEPNLVAYYNFDQGLPEGDNTGLDSLIDLTTNALDGTLNGFVYTGNTSNWVNSYAFSANVPDYNLLVLNSAASGAGSLQAAIDFANTNPGTDTIKFALPGGGPWNIPLSSSLIITGDSTVIDGTTQPGYDFGTGNMVSLTGPGGSVMGLDVNAYAADISGLRMDNWLDAINISDVSDGVVDHARISQCIFIGSSSNAIYLSKSHFTEIYNNLVGVESDTVTLDGQNGHQIETNASNKVKIYNNVIVGGLTSDYGIRLVTGDSISIRGNYIGTNTNGDPGLGNAGGGIEIEATVTNAIIGGLSRSDRNVISGNTGDGIAQYGEAWIENNFLGVSPDGLSILANSSNGIESLGAGVILHNVIAGNSSSEIVIRDNTDALLVDGNLIGTDSTGLVLLSSNGEGIYMRAGSNKTIINNIIVGSSNDWGIETIWDSDYNVYQGNFIGTNSVNALMGNSLGGIFISDYGDHNIIGGNLPGQENVIAINGGPAIQMEVSGSTNKANYNQILNNSIFSNVEGISFLNNSSGSELVNDGIQPPIITSVTSGSISGTVQGNLAGKNADLQIHLYYKHNGSDQGVTLVDSLNTTGDDWSFSGAFVVDTSYIATVTVDTLGTSEYSLPVSGSITPTFGPDSLLATLVPATQVDLSWYDNDTDEAGYIIERSNDKLNWIIVADEPADATSFSDFGAFDPDYYFYRVSAFNGGGAAPDTTHAAVSSNVAPGFALDFDGADDEVNVGDITELNSTSAFTIEGWFNQDALDVTGGMFGKISSTTSMIRARTWSDGNLFSYVHNGTTNCYGYFDYSQVITAGEWFHYAMVFDGTKPTNAERLKIYINGQQQSLTFVGTIPASTSDLTGIDFVISEDNTIASKGENWNGQMDEIRIWGKALSENTLFNYIYQSIDNSHPDYPELIAHYPFDKGTGSSTLYDLKSTYDGALTNMDAASDWVVSAAMTTASSTTVVNTLDDGAGSLRAAIEYANINPGPDTIQFDILSSGPWTITPVDLLPTITDDSLVIDGSTQLGWDPSSGMMITLDGSNWSSNNTLYDGLEVNAENVEIYGLRFKGWGNQAIEANSAHHLIIGDLSRGNIFLNSANSVSASNADYMVFQGNLVGVDYDTLTAGGMTNYAVTGTNSDSVLVLNNIIGFNGASTTFTAIRFTSGNYGHIRGNYIGVSPSGADIGNTGGGIAPDISNVVIGGPNEGDRNYIAGNGSNGVSSLGHYGIVQNNYIGITPQGTVLGNSGTGVAISNRDYGQVLHNVITGNTSHGISFNSTPDSVVIMGNLIGLTPDTLSAPGNGSSTDGIHINFGSKAQILNNYIGNAGQWGIRIYFDSDETRIQGNVIGTGVSGTEDFGCGYGGITLVYRPSFSVIGGNLPGQENIIAYNNGPAIDFDLPTSGTSATESFFVLNNSIYENTEGIIANSPSTSGAVLNKGILPPVIQTFNASTIAGTLQGNLGGYTGEVQLHLYESDGSLSPQGKTLIDSANVIGDIWSFSGSFDENKVYLATVSVDTMGTSLYAQAISNFAVALDGTNDYVDLGSGFATAMAGQQSSFTAEWWIKMETDATNSQDGMLAVNASTGTNSLLILYKNNAGSRIFTIYDGVSGADEIIYNGVILGEWYHVAYSTDGTTGSMYVNGELIGTHTPDYTFTATDLWSIGMEYDSGPTPGDYADATFDEFRIWNVARSAFEIKSAYRHKVAFDTPGLFTYYPMSEGPGFSVLGDSTGNGYDGNLINVDNSSIWIQGVALDNPQPYIQTVYPANDGTDIALDSIFSIVFNTTVQAGSGFIHAIDQADSSVVESINVALTDGMPSDSVWLSFSNLQTGGTYSITIDSGAFVLGDVAYPGLIDTTFWSFTMVDNPPLAPSDLTVLDHGDGTFTLNWVDNASDETDYKIQKSYDKITWADEAVGLGIDQTSFITAVQPLDTGYWWRAVVVGPQGDGPSNEVFSDTYTYEHTALVLDGTDDYLSVGNIHDFTTGDFTIEAWVRRDAINETGWVMSVGDTPSSNSYLHFGFGAGNILQVDLYSGDNVAATSGVSDNYWHHIAVTFKNTTGATRLYLDGEDVTPADSLMTNFVGDNDFKIGQAFDTEFFQGAVDEVKVWNVVKSDFSDIYGPVPGDTSGLVLYYKMNEGQGLETFDQTGGLTRILTGTMDDTDWISSGAFDKAPVIVSRLPNIGDTEVPLNTTIQATFDQNIVIGTGNIEIWNRLDSTLVETFDVTTDVTVVGNVLEFSPGLLQIATEYSVLIPENAVMSLTGKTAAAIVALSAWTFTTQAQSSISITNPVNFDFVDPSILQDVEFSATGYAGTDNLEISASYDGGDTYSLLTTGTIDDLTIANYQWDASTAEEAYVYLKIENIDDQAGGYKDSIEVYVDFPIYIEAPYIGDEFFVGESFTIIWNLGQTENSADLSQISISYDGGATYTILKTGDPFDDYLIESYEFDTVAQQSSANTVIKVENLTNPYEWVSQPFTVVDPYITFYEPSAEGNLTVGESIYFDFEVFGINNSDIVEFSYSGDGGTTYTVVETGNPFNFYGSTYFYYSFTLEDTAIVESARVKVTNVTTGYEYESDIFQIGPPNLTYLYPYDAYNCGEYSGSMDIGGLAYGLDYNLTFTHNGNVIDTMSVYVSEGASIYGLPAGEYTDISAEIGGVSSNIISGPIYIDDGSPRIYLTGLDNTACSTGNGSIYVYDSVALSLTDFRLYAGTDTSAVPLQSTSDMGSWTFSDLEGGLYTVVTELNGSPTCVDVESITISDVPDLPIIDSNFANLVNPSTVGGSNGFIDVDAAVSGGSGEFSYQWYYGVGTSTIMTDSTGSSIGNLPAGSYTVVATDGGGSGCESEATTFTIVDPTTLGGVVRNYVASTSAEVQLTNSEVADISYVITTSSTSPSATRISNGQDENGNPAYGAYTYLESPAGTLTFEVGRGFETDRPLAPESTYYIYFVGDNGNFSNIVSTVLNTGVSPQIASITPAVGDVGSTVSVSGTDFLSTGNRVFVGNKEVAVDTETSTSISFTVPENSTSYAPVNVLAGRAYATPGAGVNNQLNTTHLGGFINSTSYTSSQFDTNYSWDVAMGDVNGDGLMDRVRLALNAGDVVVEHRNSSNDGYETGLFFVIPTGTSFVEVADMNADGYPDIITSRTNSSGVFPVRVNYNDGTGMFNESYEALGDVNGTAVTSLSVGDLNGDGLNDVLVTTNTTSPASVIYKRADSASFEAPQALPVAGETGRKATIGDFNNDGLNDVAVTILNSDQVAVYLRNVTNTGFDNPIMITLATGAEPQAISSGDYNKDGNLDIVAGASNTSTTTSVFYVAGNGDGTFQATLALEAGDKDLRSMVTGELNGDGNLDIITGSYFNDDLRIFTGIGDGTFNDLVQVTLNGVQSIALADINGDGADDIHVGTGNNSGFELIFAAQIPDVEFSAVTVPSSDLYQGSSDNLVFATSFTVTGTPASFEGIYFNVDGDYNVTDFQTDGFELWYNVGTNDFSTATSAGTTSLGVLSDTTVGWSFTETFAAGSTVYLYTSASIASDAVVSGSFNIGLDVDDPVESFGVADPKNKFTSDLVDGNLFSIISADTIPPSITGDTLVSINENTTAVNTYTAGETVTWTLSGADAASFDITVDGELTLLAAADFEVPVDANADNIYELVLEASDSLLNSVSHIVEVTILDVNDNTPVITDPGAVSLFENITAGSEVVALEFTDADTTSATYTWSIESGNMDVNLDSNLPFSIGDTDGIITVSDSADIDFELVTQFDLSIGLTDGINSTTFALTITINDIPEGQDPETEADSLALLSIYDALSGADWTAVNWKESVPLTEWTGVTMTDTRVTALDLSSNNLKGDFPAITAGLEALTSLILKDNQITSILDLSNLIALSTADVSENKLGFASLEVLFFGDAEITVSPQKTVLSKVRTLEEIGTTYTVDRTVSGSANIYTWTKNGVAIAQTTASFDVAIENFTADGTYVAKVTSGVIPLIELTTEPVVLRVSSIERDSAALRAVYDAMDGANSSLSDWPSLAVQDWPELTITGNRVVGLSAPEVGLTGSLPEDITDVKGLINVDLSGNDIDGLPNLEGYLPNLTSFDVSGNKLTFEDLEENTAVAGIDYSDQQLIGSPLTEVIPEGSDYTIDVPVGGTSNAYEWTLISPVDTAVVASASTSSLGISGIDYETMGVYTLSVTNELVPDLVLKSEPQQVLASATLGITALDQGDDQFTTAEALVLKIRPAGQKYDTIQRTSETVSGAFVFEGLILDNYKVAVAPNNNNEFLATYFESNDRWRFADTLRLRRDSAETLSMIVNPGAKGGGGTTGASVSGTVESDFPEGEGGRIEARRKVKRAACSVRRFVPKGRTDQEEEDGEFVLYAYVESDDEGQFEFTELESGRYRFNIEYPGIPMDEDSFVEFTIGEGGIEEESLILQATVTEDGIVVEKIERLGFYRKYFKDLSVYPNPADNYLTIGYGKLLSSNVTVRLIDLDGKVVKEQGIEKGNDLEFDFDVSEITNGIYLLNFVDASMGAENITTFKVFVKH